MSANARKQERRGGTAIDRRTGERRGRSAWVGEPLPRGRHKLDPDVVRASQRERLIRAILETVAEQGYEATTVPEVVARARVSRNAFYEFFADKTNCFIAACDEEASELLGVVLESASASSWTDALRQGTRAYLTWWAERPALPETAATSAPSRARWHHHRNRAPAHGSALPALGLDRRAGRPPQGEPDASRYRRSPGRRRGHKG